MQASSSLIDTSERDVCPTGQSPLTHSVDFLYTSTISITTFKYKHLDGFSMTIFLSIIKIVASLYSRHSFSPPTASIG